MSSEKKSCSRCKMQLTNPDNVSINWKIDGTTTDAKKYILCPGCTGQFCIYYEVAVQDFMKGQSRTPLSLKAFIEDPTFMEDLARSGPRILNFVYILFEINIYFTKVIRICAAVSVLLVIINLWLFFKG